MNNTFVDIKKIVGNKSNAGIYAIGDNTAIQLIDINDNVIVKMSIYEKINLFHIILDKMINNGINEDLIKTTVLFKCIMDEENKDIEYSVNELFKKVFFLYSKPNIDIKEILSIADLVSNRLNQDNRNNKYVKEELQKRLHYV